MAYDQEFKFQLQREAERERIVQAKFKARFRILYRSMLGLIIGTAIVSWLGGTFFLILDLPYTLWNWNIWMGFVIGLGTPMAFFYGHNALSKYNHKKKYNNW